MTTETLAGAPTIEGRTATYRVTPARYLRAGVARSVAGWAVALSVVVGGCCAAALALSDLRWAVVALMVMLVVAPMVALPLLLARLMHPGVRLRVGLLRVTVPVQTGGSISVERLSEPGDEKPAAVVAAEQIPANEATGLVKAGRSMMLLTFSGAERRLPLLVPTSLLAASQGSTS